MPTAPSKPIKKAELEVENIRNCSRLTTAYAETPLRLLTPGTHTAACHVQLSNYGGGFVSGDVVNLAISCRPDTKLCLGTQANTRVYRTENDQWSGQTITGKVAANALAVVCQDPLVLHADARFRQEQEWHVEDTGSLLLTEWLASGRHETGERFEFAKFESSMRIEHDGNPRIVDRYQLDRDNPTTLAGSPFGEYDQMLVIYAFGSLLTPHLATLQSLANDHQRVEPLKPLIVWHEVQGGGILRCLAHNRSELTNVWVKLSALLANDDLLGFNPTSRKF